MKRNSFYAIATIVLALILTIGILSIALAHPVPHPPASNPPFLTPAPVPSPHGWKNTSTGIWNGQFNTSGGLDAGNGLVAAGNDDSEPSIRIHNGDDWSEHSVHFQPTGLEWSNNEADILYASDNINSMIWFTPDPAFNPSSWIPIGLQGSELGQFNNPNGMWSDADTGILYIVDTGNYRVQFVDHTGAWGILPIAPFELLYPIDICVFNGTIYVTDYTAHCIYYQSPGDLLWKSIKDETYLWYPSYMDVNEHGEIFIEAYVNSTDGFQKNIVKYSGGVFSAYVTSGSGPGLMSNNGTSEEISINEHDCLFYRDPQIGLLYKELCDVNLIHTFDLNGTVYPVIGPETNIYHTEPNDIENLVLDAFKVCPFSTITGDGLYPLAVGENNFPVRCISESGIPREYIIHVKRELSDNALLSDLALNGITILGFASETYNYIISNYSYDPLGVNLSAVAQNSEASVSGTGQISLIPGLNTLIVTVIAPDGISINHYTIQITMDAPPASPTPSPSPTPTASPNPTPSPSPTPTIAPSESPAPSPSTSPYPSPEPSVSAAPTETPNTGTPIPSPSISPSASPPVNPSLMPSTTQPAPSPLPASLIKNRDIRNILIYVAIGLAAGALGFIGAALVRNYIRKRRPNSRK